MSENGYITAGQGPGQGPGQGQKKHIISELEDYMFNSKLMRNTLRQLKPIVAVREKSEHKHKYHRNIYVPHSGDTLFWVFYIMANGVEKYELLGKNTFLAEKNEKIKGISTIGENKAKLKDHGIKKVSTCESDLMNEKTISLKTFHMLCVCHDIDFLFLRRRLYYMHVMGDDVGTTEPNSDTPNPVTVIHELDDGAYGCEVNPHDTVFKNYTDTRMKMENYEKPIKAVSGYTIVQLRELCGCLKIQTLKEDGKTKTKGAMYADLTLYLDIVSGQN
jgi:hypothetical protein